jgi:hypothetical protein
MQLWRYNLKYASLYSAALSLTHSFTLFLYFFAFLDFQLPPLSLLSFSPSARQSLQGTDRKSWEIELFKTLASRVKGGQQRAKQMLKQVYSSTFHFLVTFSVRGHSTP